MKILPFFLLLISSHLFAQNNEKEKLENLERLKVEFSNSYDQQQKRVAEYASKNNISIKQFLPQGNLIELVDVDPFGQPVFRETINSGLAISTNVPKLRSGGGLGLNLLGAGIEVAVWDGGPTFDHIEFVDRILAKESGTALDHATHVSGTILASGINASAKGMAPSAKLYSFDWSNDRAEMISLARPDQTGLLFSNHSYGLVQGWNCSNGSCNWTGTPSISDKEDWRFGFYTTLAKDIDQIAFNAPYYSIFWAAGNDRDDYATTGPAIYPPDGNQGSGYDCIGQEGTAKNIFTIGASRKVLSYTGPTSVEMSSFSGWGPTDDGRIKPDLVAPGVNIFSTVLDNNYANNSGTSMATPGALGSLLLLQELHRDLNGGKFMRSATLKALAIHTAKEAGQYPGPDYSFGWGLIDVEAAAKVLLEQDNQNVIVSELELTENQNYQLVITPQTNIKITATIVWTDPAGTPVGSSLDPTDLMLVNDLDMRIVDEANNQQFPWKLNPELGALGEPAYKGDNFRDNVEKIEFENPEPRNYTLTINHKGTLTGGSQKFSLILTYTSTIEPQVAYYWVGGSGDWNDPNHWSLVSGGISAGEVPKGDNKAIVDENSFTVDNGFISLLTNSSIGSLSWLNKLQTGINLDGNTLTINGNLIISSNKTQILSGGKILFTSNLNEQNKILTNANDFSSSDLEIDASAKIEMSGSLKAHSIKLLSGFVDMTGFNLETESFQTSNKGSVSLSLNNATLSNIIDLHLNSDALELFSDGATITTGINSVIDLAGHAYNGKIIVPSKNVLLVGDNTIKELEVSGELLTDGNNYIDILTLQSNSSLSLNEGTVQHLTESTAIFSSATSPVIIQSSGKAFLSFDARVKLCYDNLNIKNVDVIGDAVVNAGLSSSLENSMNWAKGQCDSILFPDFDFTGTCVDGIVQLIDRSGGSIELYEWGANTTTASILKPHEKNGAIVFSEIGEFEISLTISNNNDSRTFSKTITILPNDLPPNQIIINGLNLFSVQSSETYEWYRNSTIIPNAVGRSYPFNGEPGTYTVLTKSTNCNRVSDFVLITGTSLENSSYVIQIYPNPATDRISINGLSNNSKVRIESAAGLLLYEVKANESLTISTNNWARGIYLVSVSDAFGYYIYKIILK